MSKIYVRKIRFDFFTVDINLTVVFEPVEYPTDELIYRVYVYENGKVVKESKAGGNINKTKALKFLKGY